MHKNYIISILLLITFPVILFSQSVTDSLINVLQKADKEQKAQIYNQLSYEFLLKRNFEESSKYASSALVIATETKNYNQILEANANLADIEFSSGNFKQCIEHIKDAIDIIPNTDNENLAAFVYNLAGDAHFYLNNYELALNNWQEALAIREKMGDTNKASDLILNIGFIYKNKGEYKKAINIYEKALKFQKEKGNDLEVGRILGNIGNIYFYSGLDYSLANQYYFESLEYFDKAGEISGKANIYNSIGLVFDELDSNNKALEYLNMSLEIFNETNNLKGKAQTLNSIGGIYLNLKQLEKALEYFYQCIEIFEQLDEKRDLALTYNDMGQVFFLKKDYRRALRYKLSALNVLKQLNAKKELSDLYIEISDIYAELNDFQNAYKYHANYAKLRDSIFTSEYTSQISEWQTKYDTEKKEQELLQQEAELKRKNIMIYSFVGLMCIVLIFSVLLYKQFSDKKKANVLLQGKNEQISKQNKEITDSIQYASRIQNAVLPNSDHLNRIVSDHFILFKPKDIVSGDFYWMTANENKAVLVAADCTGHGVPGAFMSMLGISFLAEIVKIDNNIYANKILNELRHLVKTTLAQSGTSIANDGMDISLVIIDKEKMELQYAGAYNHLYLFKNNEFIKVKADRMPIGNYKKEKASFTNNVISLSQNETFYMFSDGYADQFGGDNNEKFSSKALQELLFDIHKDPMHEQRKILYNNYSKWKGDRKQIDDVLIIGIRI